MNLAFDPLWGLTVRLGIGLLFVSALVHKLRSFIVFEGILAGYLQGLGLRQKVLVRPVAVTVVLLEALTALLCLTAMAEPAGALLAEFVLLGYALAIGLNLARGHALPDCGCSWGRVPQPTSAALVVRNLVLAGLAMLTVVPTTAREIGALDIVSAVFALIASAAVYAAINQLMALTMATGRPAR